MDTKIEGYRKYFFIAIIFIALGVNFSTILKDSVSSLGPVLIAVGGLFFIIAMSKKKKLDEQKNK